MSISTKKMLSSDEVRDFMHNKKEFLSSIDNRNIPLKPLTIEVPEYSVIRGVKVSAVKQSSLRRHAYKTRGRIIKNEAKQHEKD